MKAIHRCAIVLGLGCMMVTPALAQDKAPAQPSGTRLTEADHRQNVSQLNTFEWHNPASNIQGISTMWPDGTSIVSVKLADGSLRNNVGVWRIDGDKFCQKMRIPADAEESCIHSYKTGDNEYQGWNVNGKFGSFWRFRK